MEYLAQLVWGVPAMAAFVAVGILLSVRSGFVQLRQLGPALAQVGRGGRSSFQAVCTALAGTVGTGNIAGVAGAIALGGPGAVFWMWISAFLGMATKYAEVFFSVRFRQMGEDGTASGGPMYYIRFGLGEGWMPAAAGFCFFAVLASFCIGNMAQVSTVVSAVCTMLPRLSQFPTALATGLLCALISLMLTSGNGSRLGAAMEKLLPAAAGIYVLAALAVIVRHGDRLPAVLRQIVAGAFCPQAVLGGGAGIGLRQSIRWGVSRGVFSNEAGLGSAPMAHAAAKALPREQGLYGIFEVFFDTVVLCTLTALAILCSGIPVRYGSIAGAELAVEALRTVFGGAAPVLMTLCLSLLSLATVVTWQYYGQSCAGFLWGSRGASLHRLLFSFVILLGAVLEPDAVWALCDITCGLMALPNLAALVALSGRYDLKPSCKTDQFLS